MKILFDLCGTVFGLKDDSLRPGIKELIRELQCAGHNVCFWTGGDVNGYRLLLKNAEIVGHEVFDQGGPLPFVPDLYVDDCVFPSEAKNVIEVKPYIGRGFPSQPINFQTFSLLMAKRRCAIENRN